MAKRVIMAKLPKVVDSSYVGGILLINVLLQIDYGLFSLSTFFSVKSGKH